MRYLLITLLLIPLNCFAFGLGGPLDSVSQVETLPESTVLYSQLLENSTSAYPSFYQGSSFTLSSSLGEDTMTFEMFFSSSGNSCEIRVGDNGNIGTDLTTYIVAETFTSSTGTTTKQVATGNLSAGTYAFGIHCNAGSIYRYTSNVLNSLIYRFGSSWNLASTEASDLKIRISKP